MQKFPKLSSKFSLVFCRSVFTQLFITCNFPAFLQGISNWTPRFIYKDRLSCFLISYCSDIAYPVSTEFKSALPGPENELTITISSNSRINTLIHQATVLWDKPEPRTWSLIPNILFVEKLQWIRSNMTSASHRIEEC